MSSCFVASQRKIGVPSRPSSRRSFSTSPFSRSLNTEKAAARLGVSESALEDLIDSGQLTTHPYVGDIYLDANQVAALARSRNPTPKAKRPTPFVDWSPLARIRDLKASGTREISAPQA